ncbi:MAG: hypothetical protein WA941_11090, partial [Nitrososphaeraceae archaeon]
INPQQCSDHLITHIPKLDTLPLLFASRFVFGILKITTIIQWNHIISCRDLSGEDGAELVLIY